ncbi:MAG: AEC family transporter [Pseudomonadota bacterium]
MQALLDVILPVFLVIGAGYVATWRGYFSQVAVDGLMKFTQNFAIPCLLFAAIARLDLGAEVNAPLLASFYTAAIACFLLGVFAARLIFGRTLQDSVSIGFACLFSNSVLLGLPITERAFGPDALAGNFAIVAFHAPVMYLIGVTVMEVVRGAGQSAGATVRKVVSSMFHNALIVGIGLGVLVNVTGLPLPQVVFDGADLMARAALPAALFGLGGVLVQYRPEGDLKVIAMVCGISLLVHPSLAWMLGRWLELDRDAFRSVILTAAMAPGINAYIFANIYGAAKRVAASSVLLSTALSVLSVWFWLLLLP